MKSRLKELKDNHEFRKGEGWGMTTLSEDVDWLIVQAEKVEELEQELILAYKSRKNGGMFWAGELNAINKRIEELERE